MLKNKLSYLIIPITLAVVALVALQLYWISNAVSLKESQFEDSVKKSMSELANEIRKYERVNRMKENDWGKTLLDQIQNQNGNVQFRDTIVIIDGQEVRQQYIENGSPDNGYYFSSSSYGDQNQQMDINLWAANSLQDQGGLSSFLGDAFNLNMLKSLNERLPAEALDSLLKKEFEENGLSADYEFVVFDAVGTANYVKNDQSFEIISENIESTYSTSLFPEDLFGSPYSISVLFPNKRSYVIGRMWGVLLLSLLLVAGLIYAFYFTISTIYRQKRLSEIKNDFIGNMTHELKTPISTISLACEALSDSDIQSTEAQRSSFVRMISEENKRLGVLVENVLQSAVIDRGELKLKSEEIYLNDVIEKAVNNIRIQIESKSGKLVTQLDATNNVLIGDRVHITNVIYNLLDNANKYTPENPEIIISTEDIVNGVIVKVKDNGVGINKENQKRIFDKLFRVPTGNIHNVKGFGLGLSYVQAIIEKHSGQIKVNSALGKGSTFSIELPASAIK